MRLTLLSFRTVLAGVGLGALFGAQAQAVNIPYSNWQGDGFTANAKIFNLNSDSPVLGDGTSQSVKENAIYATFDQVDLQIGDKITFSGSFMTEGSDTINSNTGGLRIGLFNDITTDDDNPNATPNTGWIGYFARTVSNSGNTVLQGRTTTTTAAPLSGTGATGIGSSVTASGSFANGGVYTFELTVECTTSEILLSASFGDGYSVSVSPIPAIGASPLMNTTSFDRVAIYSTGAWASATNIARISFSNLAMTYTPIPEPHSIVLVSLGLCSLGWVALKKRRISS